MLRKIVILWFFIFPILIFSQTEIDVLKLKNGDIIKGKIIENKINKHIKIELQGGSILTYEYDKILEIETEDLKVNKSIPQPSGAANLSDTQILYAAKEHAKEDWQYNLFSSSTTQGEWLAFGGTFISAFLLSPLIGGSLGMVASYASGVNAKIPLSRLNSVDYNNMNAQQKEIYDRSYKEEAEGHLKQRNLIGSVSGCVTAWSILTSIITSSDTGY